MTTRSEECVPPSLSVVQAFQVYLSNRNRRLRSDLGNPFIRLRQTRTLSTKQERNCEDFGLLVSIPRASLGTSIFPTVIGKGVRNSQIPSVGGR